MRVKPPDILAPRAMPAVVNTLEAELMAEKAATLGRLTQAFEVALAAYLAHASAEEVRGPAKRERAQMLDDAAEALWHFVVQREACGLRNTEAVLREYNVPPAVRLRMGVRRRG